MARQPFVWYSLHLQRVRLLSKTTDNNVRHDDFLSRSQVVC
jgi:hypothetical protein